MGWWWVGLGGGGCSDRPMWTAVWVGEDDRVQSRAYRQPADVAPPSRRAVAALVLGIVSVLGGVFLVVPPVLALRFGHQVLRDTGDGLHGGRWMAVAGLILGYVALGLLVIGVLVGAMALIATYGPA